MKRKREEEVDRIKDMYKEGCKNWDALILDPSVSHPLLVDHITVSANPVVLEEEEEEEEDDAPTTATQVELELDFPLEFRVKGVEGTVILCWPWIKSLTGQSILARMLDNGMNERREMLETITWEHPYPVVTMTGADMEHAHPEDLMRMFHIIRCTNTGDDTVLKEIQAMDTPLLIRMAFLGDQLDL